jgi:hypothetical protein
MRHRELAMTSPPDGVQRAIELAEKAEPTPEEAEFLERFFADHLRPRPGEDPAAHAARLTTPDLFKLYRRLRTDVLFAPPASPAPAEVAASAEHHESVAARVLSERTPAASSHVDFVDIDEDYTPAGRNGTQSGGDFIPGSPAASQRAECSRVAQNLSDKDGGNWARVSRFVHGHKRAARLLIAAVAISGASYGMMYLINRQAHRSAEPIRQIQQQTGKAAEGIPADPSRAPIDNRVRSASASTAPQANAR